MIMWKNKQKKFKIDAYAKINLHLDVTELRGDGYHNIQSVMQSISLCDTLDIEIINENKIIIKCETPGVPLDERNIAYKAARRFFEKAGLECGAIIKIAKNIPMAAGLAGGSADAAATLIGLNRLLDKPLSEDELYSLGSSLGADVPFCMSCGCCLTSEIGDKLLQIEPLNGKTILVIACGGEGVSTPVAYRLLDIKYKKFANYTPKEFRTLIDALPMENSDFYKHIFNIFEEPISQEWPAVNIAKGIMLENGAKGAMMSGSGPSVFGIFADIYTAKNALFALKEKGYFASIAYPTAKR